MLRSYARSAWYRTARSLPLVAASSDLDQWSSEIRKLAGIKHLDARVALPIEGGGAWSAGFRSVCWGIEPQAQMIGMNPSGYGAQCSVRKSVVEHHRRR